MSCPIHHVYDGVCAYRHTINGMKRHAMQTNPQVCFEVERVGDFHYLASADRRGSYSRAQWR